MDIFQRIEETRQQVDVALYEIPEDQKRFESIASLFEVSVATEQHALELHRPKHRLSR